MTNDFTDFDGQEEVEVKSLPTIRQFKKADVFIGFISSVNDNQLAEEKDNGMGGKTWGTKVFSLIAIGDKNVDHKSEDGTATGDAVANEIVAGGEYKIFTNYVGKDFLNVNGSKLSELPLGAVVKIENLGKKKSEKSSFSYKDQSIIAKKDKAGAFMIHPDYTAIDDFSKEKGTADDLLGL